jgi:1-acyl-sn-glycerol-3-phosphate acyltransferase
MHEGDGAPEDNVIPLRRSDPTDELDAETLDALREALEDLRREIRSRMPEHRGGDGAGASGIDVVGLVDGLRSRLAHLGIRERRAEIDEFGMDAELVERAAPLLDWMRERYWRVDVVGADKLPEEGPVLFVANRSGLLPYDGVMLAHIVEGLAPRLGRPRHMVADWLVTLPFVQPFLARVGGVRACRENADRLLRTGRSVIAFPEGGKGATKTFRERYRLKRFGRGGVVRAAIETGVPIVPVGIVGAEEAHPVLFKAWRPARSLGLPFLPVTPTFPLLGPLGLLPLPTKWVIVIGDPIDPPTPSDADDEELIVSRSTAALREQIQTLVEEGLDRRESVWD